MSHAWAEWQDGLHFLKDDMLERRYREHGPAYFGRLVRRSRVMTAAEVMDLLEPIVEHGSCRHSRQTRLPWPISSFGGGVGRITQRSSWW